MEKKENTNSVPAINGGVEDVFVTPKRRIGRETMLIAGVCLAIAALLRFVALGRRDLYGGEYFGLDYIESDRPNLFDEIFHGHLPLYYEFLRLWGRIVGTTSDALLRAPSAVFSLAACVAFFLFAFRFLRGLAFVLCLVGFALNPTLVRTGNDVSSYALLSLFVVGSHYYAVRALDEGKKRHWVWWALTSALGALTHPFFWFVLLGQFLFALTRPKKTPRGFVLLAGAGTFAVIALMLFGAVYAKRHLQGLAPDAPSLADLARGLVAATVGDFPRYRYGDRVFVRTLLYLFVFVSLLLSWVYYRLRQAEAEALPENVVFVDETQDVIGHWTRLSLASFLLYLWVTFLVPAVAIMLVGGFASGHTLRPEYFIVCLPPMIVLIACGIDGAPGRAGTVVLGLLFVLMMTTYNLLELDDRGYGIKEAANRTKNADFSVTTDTFLVVTPGGIERALQRYLSFVPYTELRPPSHPETCDKFLSEKTQDKERAFLLYHDDFRRIGKSDRSLVREWFGIRKDKWDTDKKWILSEPEKTELRIYVRIDPNKTPPRID
ncbi:MAG: glycosyltransferase family 39 protein [Candidatus Sumerlaeaceae bacterium]|nr:glycosyltransferase family 39 protein [Candidatus Sumerlaeaceae bacterium]